MSTEGRPNPDQLLAQVQADEAKAARGKLKIFFGAAPGVGKTYAMLEAGRKAGKEGVNVLVGYIEPHVRPETAALVLGLDMLPRKEIHYRGRTLLEFDLEAAQAQKPALILVDELAHTNAPGLTHAKRYQDVNDLLDAGIDVYTTLNVQHLESLNDVIAQITGVIVRETVPDSIFENADEIELVDIAPDDLIERLVEGKVYVAEQAQRAVQNFFSKGNLLALRELALRRAAERVDAQMDDYRRSHAISRTWAAAERLLVCVGPSPTAPRLVRATRRMATGLRCQWFAVHVETPEDSRLGEQDRERLSQTIHLAEQLGAETAVLYGTNVADAVLQFAREQNVTKIIVGKSHQPRWREWLRGSYVYELTRKCGDIDIYVISGDVDARLRVRPRRAPSQLNPWGYAWAMAMVAVATGLSALAVEYLAVLNLVMIYLLGLVVVALRCGRGPSILAAFLSVLAFDFFFIPPRWTFAVADTQYLITFLAMLITGLVISTLTSRVKAQAEAAGEREKRTAALYAMSRPLMNARSIADVAGAARQHISGSFDADVFVLLPLEPGKANSPLVEGDAFAGDPLTDHDRAVAEWSYKNRETAGRGTDTLPSSSSVFVPLVMEQRTLGVLGIRPRRPMSLLTADERRLLETFAGQIALAVERVRAEQEAERSRVLANTEQLRNSLLSAVSHDLRTPLAAIVGASSTLVQTAELTPDSRSELAQSIYDEATRLNRIVANLLEMTRLDSGNVLLDKHWQPLEEVIGAALNRLSKALGDRLVTTHVDPELPLVAVDDLLIQQVLVNLLENAIKYAPTGTPIDISASADKNEIIVEVADRGPGLGAGEAERIFDKFYQAKTNGRRSGVGLGLAVCRGIVELHGGRIWAENRVGGGAVFRFTLPRDGAPPDLPPLDQAQLVAR